jgi:hypothetical protein
MTGQHIFEIRSASAFEKYAMEIFLFQSRHNPVYKKYLELIKCKSTNVSSISEIPFLPVEFFKTHDIKVGSADSNRENGLPGGKSLMFTSSGTTGQELSRHVVADVRIYEMSFRKCFEMFYGPASEYCILALLPSYLERDGSSLVYMMDTLVRDSGRPQSGFFLHDHEKLCTVLAEQKKLGQKTLVLGVTYALLDFAEKHPLHFPELIVMETGGMKGKRPEMIRPDVHAVLKKAFGVRNVHSEYGMTELLSQAYSKGDGIFKTPPWMKIVVHQQSDLFSEAEPGQTGVISVIDLANVYSCSFITTQDVGRKHDDGTFEVLGRTDYSDVRGCNLMVE